MRIVARVGVRRSSLPPFFLLSVTLHVGFVAALLLLPNLRPKRAFPIEPSIQAVLLPASSPRQASPAPAAPPAPTVAPDPEPEPPTPEPAAIEEAPPEPIPDPNPPAKPKPKKEPPKVKPAPPKPKPAAPSGPATDSPAAAGSDGPVGNPAGADALAGMGSEFSWYRDAVARALYSSWQQPLLNSAEPLEVAVAFEIVRGGTVRNVRIERSSGDATVDRSVLRAVHEATLPPLPRNYGQAVQPAVFVFRLYPE